MDLREDPAWTAWLNEATGKIYWGLERCEVRRELAEHLEDKTLALCRSLPGLSQEEARQMALEQMGPAEALRERLARLYDPLGGGLCLASQCLVWAAAVFCGVSTFLGLLNLWQMLNLF